MPIFRFSAPLEYAPYAPDAVFNRGTHCIVLSCQNIFGILFNLTTRTNLCHNILSTMHFRHNCQMARYLHTTHVCIFNCSKSPKKNRSHYLEPSHTIKTAYMPPILTIIVEVYPSKFLLEQVVPRRTATAAPSKHCAMFPLECHSLPQRQCPVRLHSTGTRIDWAYTYLWDVTC